MNCKPGDMAVVVRGPNQGLIVEVVEVSESYGPPHWRVHTAWPARGTFPDGTVAQVRIGSIHDSRLRAIRPEAAAPEMTVAGVSPRSDELTGLPAAAPALRD